MIYTGDTKEYIPSELETSKRIRDMVESKEKEAAKRGFTKATGKIFPIFVPGSFHINLIREEIRELCI